MTVQTDQKHTVIPLSQKAAKNATWIVSGQAASVLLRFAASAILWRLLDADEFGLMVIVFVFLQGMHMLSDFGAEPAIVQSKRGCDFVFRNTIWTVQVIRGVLLWLASCALAVPMAALYDTRLLFILPTTGLTALITGFCSTAVYVQSRELRLGGVIVNEIVAQAVGAAVGVIWAFISPSAWALVACSITTSASTTILSFRLPASAQRFALNRFFLSEQLRFGRWITLSSISAFLAAGTDRLILGRLVPTTVLGVYGNALSLSQMPAQFLQSLGSRILFPVLAMSQREGYVSKTFTNAKDMFVSAAGIGVAGLIVTGPAVVPLLFGAKAAAAGWMVQILAAGMWFQVLEALNSKVVFVRGDTKWIAAATIVRFVVIAVALPLSFGLDGVRGALICVSLSDLPRYIVSAIGATRAGVDVLSQDIAVTAMLTVAISVGLWVSLQFADVASQWSVVLGALVAFSLWFLVRMRAMLAALRLMTVRRCPAHISALG